MNPSITITDVALSGDAISRVSFHVSYVEDRKYMMTVGNHFFPIDNRPARGTSHEALAALVSAANPSIRTNFISEWNRRTALELHDEYPEFTPPPIREISFRQLIMGLLGGGFITQAEALAAAENRTMPQALVDVINSMSSEKQLAARITWLTMTSAIRSDPLFAALVASGKATEAQVDALFKNAASL